jgi:hypothetical protein
MKSKDEIEARSKREEWREKHKKRIAEFDALKAEIKTNLKEEEIPGNDK